MAKNFYQSLTADTSPGPSPSIWGDFPALEVLEDPGVAVHFFQDFVEFEENNHGWLLAGTNGTQALTATESHALAIGVSGADNDDNYMSSGNNEQGWAKIDTTAPRDLWFEARVKLSSVTDIAHFVGLSKEGLAAADTLSNDDGDLASKDFVGFHVDTGAPTALDAVWRTAGATAQVHSAGVQTLAISTWYKLGLRYLGDEDILRYYVNGVQVGLDLDVSAATDFPSGEELCALIGIHDGAGAASNITVDWIRGAQRR